jgi:hypothetical protein
VTRFGNEAARFLRSHPGHAFCDGCLAQRLGSAVRDVRRARIVLSGSTEFDQEPWFCSVCLEYTQVIHVAWLRFDAPHPEEATLDVRD